jgi:hypothetical protein
MNQVVTQTLDPNIVSVVLATEPPGLPLSLNGVDISTPQSIISWQGLGLDISASPIVESLGQSWRFAAWSDGGAATHTIITPPSATTYTATFMPISNVTQLLRLENANFAYVGGPSAIAPAGVLRINATLSNVSPSVIHDIFIKVRTLTGGNVVLNAMDGPAGVGAIVPVAPTALGADGLLQPGERFHISFRIGLRSFNSFRFVGDAFGLTDGVATLPQTVLASSLRSQRNYSSRLVKSQRSICQV